MNPKRILICMCLCGVACRYNGKCAVLPNARHSISNPRLQDSLSYLDVERPMLDVGCYFPVCPEQLGGLSTPRPPAEIQGGDGFDVLDGKAEVIDKNGRNVTKEFFKGAEETLKLARTLGCSSFIGQDRSPSCGTRNIYDGSFSGRLKTGCGVTTALLSTNKIIIH